jgi:hypothetical protein
MKGADSVEAQSISGFLVGSLRRSDPDEAGPDTIDRVIESRARSKTPKEIANERAAADKAAKVMYEAANEEALYWQGATYYKRAARVHTAIAARLEAKATALLERGEA